MLDLPGKVRLLHELEGFLYKQRRVDHEIGATKTIVSSTFSIHCYAMTSNLLKQKQIRSVTSQRASSPFTFASNASAFNACIQRIAIIETTTLVLTFKPAHVALAFADNLTNCTDFFPSSGAVNYNLQEALILLSKL